MCTHRLEDGATVMQMVSCVNKKFLFCISLLMCHLQKGICRLIIASLQPGGFHHSISTDCINREKALCPTSLLCSFRPREAGNLHIYHSERHFGERKILHIAIKIVISSTRQQHYFNVTDSLNQIKLCSEMKLSSQGSLLDM